MQKPKFIDRNGIRFYIQSTGRYYASREKIVGQRLLHRVVWTEANGSIPDGFDVHHKNEDWADNRIENLECLPARTHQRKHMLERMSTPEYRAAALVALESGRGAARDWHASEAGLAWHSANGKASWSGREPVICQCTVCAGDYESFFPTESKFCSKACSQKGCYQKQRTEPKACAFCGDEFLANRYRDIKCCSKKCANRMRAASEKSERERMTQALTQPQRADIDRLLDATEQINDLLDLESDATLAPVCDLSGDKTCESCQ